MVSVNQQDNTDGFMEKHMFLWGRNFLSVPSRGCLHSHDCEDVLSSDRGQEVKSTIDDREESQVKVTFSLKGLVKRD